MWITMVKVHCVVITAQVDMNFIVLCERIMKLQPAERIIKILDLDGGWCRLSTLFWGSLSSHIIIF